MFCFVSLLSAVCRHSACHSADGTDCCRPQKSSGSGKSAPEDCGDDDQNGKIHDSKADAPEKPPFSRHVSAILPPGKVGCQIDHHNAHCTQLSFFQENFQSRKTAAKEEALRSDRNEKSLSQLDPAARTHRPCFLSFLSIRKPSHTVNVRNGFSGYACFFIFVKRMISFEFQPCGHALALLWPASEGMPCRT